MDRTENFLSENGKLAKNGFPCIRVSLHQGDNVIETYLPEGTPLTTLVSIFVTTGVELRVLDRVFRSF